MKNHDESILFHGADTDTALAAEDRYDAIETIVLVVATLASYAIILAC